MANEKQRKTFLSYSRVNTDFAKRLAKELKAEGFPVWLDQLDIPLGARWDVALEKALEESEIFMIIMTPDSISSENVRDEIGYAIDTGKRFMPIMLEKCNVPLRLRRFQYVDFTTKSFEDGVESAKRLLRGLIAQDTIPRGKLPSDTQGKIAQAEGDQKTKKDAERIARRVAEEELAAKAVTDRKDKGEADRLAAQKAESEKQTKQKAEDERLAKARVETERKKKEESNRLAAQKAEADRLAKQKAEDERLAKVKAETERKANEEANRLAMQKAEADKLAEQKVEDERVAKAKTETERKEKENEEAKPIESRDLSVPPTQTQKKPLPKGLMIGIGAVVVLVIAGFGIGALSNRSTPATETPVVSDALSNIQAAQTEMIEALPTRATTTPNLVATALYEAYDSEVQDYFGRGFISNARGEIVERRDFNVSVDTLKSYINQLILYKNDSDFFVSVHAKWSIPTGEADAIGCGFYFGKEVVSGDEQYYAVFISDSRILFIYFDASQSEYYYEIEPSFGDGLVAVDDPGEADFTLVVKGNIAYVLVEREEVGRYPLPLNPSLQGDVGVWAWGPNSSQSEVQCEMTNIHAWIPLE